MLEKKRTSIALIGAGGHAKVIIDALTELNYHIAGFINPSPVDDPFFKKFNYLGDDEYVATADRDDLLLINAIGSTNSPKLRTQVYQYYKKNHYQFFKLIHPTAIVSQSASIHEGCQILAGCIIGAEAKIGENCIVNHRAIVEHECQIGKHCHIASGAILCGQVKVGPKVHIGAGATINQGIIIEEGAVIASGSTVIKNVKKNTLVAGVPAQVKKEKI